MIFSILRHLPFSTIKIQWVIFFCWVLKNGNKLSWLPKLIYIGFFIILIVFFSKSGDLYFHNKHVLWFNALQHIALDQSEHIMWSFLNCFNFWMFPRGDMSVGHLWRKNIHLSDVLLSVEMRSYSAYLTISNNMAYAKENLFMQISRTPCRNATNGATLSCLV